MSGPKGINEWERYYQANREHIEKVFGPIGKRSRQVKQMSNLQVSKDLYKMILTGETDDVLITEAAARLGAVREATTMNEASKN